jgi:hypothetical protein
MTLEDRDANDFPSLPDAQGDRLEVEAEDVEVDGGRVRQVSRSA